MKTYTKINAEFKRYQNIPKDCPNPKWKKFSNKIILGEYTDSSFEYLRDNKFEAYSKIDGTNSKICYYPSTQEIKIGGKTDNANSQHGQFEFLEAIANRILPILKEMYPIESARFIPQTDDNDKVIVNDDNSVTMIESPIYIYGEYYGQGIQKCGGSYSKENKFAVFDICQQGWWIPSDMRHDICKRLDLEEVPCLGILTLAEAEEVVSEGFTTHVANAVNPQLIEEGIVLRPIVPIKDSRGKRIIVKVKHCDFKEYNAVRKEFSDEEFEEFNKWYFENIEFKK